MAKREPLDAETKGRVEDLMSTRALDQLLGMNDLIVEEIRRRRREADLEESKKYRRGDRVEFREGKSPFAQKVRATVESVNERTLSVLADNGNGWRVAYCHVTKLEEEEKDEAKSA